MEPDDLARQDLGLSAQPSESGGFDFSEPAVPKQESAETQKFIIDPDGVLHMWDKREHPSGDPRYYHANQMASLGFDSDLLYDGDLVNAGYVEPIVGRTRHDPSGWNPYDAYGHPLQPHHIDALIAKANERTGMQWPRSDRYSKTAASDRYDWNGDPYDFTSEQEAIMGGPPPNNLAYGGPDEQRHFKFLTPWTGDAIFGQNAWVWPVDGTDGFPWHMHKRRQLGIDDQKDNYASGYGTVLPGGSHMLIDGGLPEQHYDALQDAMKAHGVTSISNVDTRYPTDTQWQEAEQWANPAPPPTPRKLSASQVMPATDGFYNWTGKWHQHPSEVSDEADRAQNAHDEQGNVIGSVLYGPGDWDEDGQPVPNSGTYIESVYVHPNHRRKGVASNLIEQARAEMGDPLRMSRGMTPEGTGLSQKFAAGQVMYHVSPRSDRESILANGLVPQPHEDDPIPGVFMMGKPQDSFLAEHPDNDHWAVDVTGLPIQEDPWEPAGWTYPDPHPYDEWGGSFVHPGTIPPERLRLLNEGTTAKTAGLWHDMEVGYHIAPREKREQVMREGLKAQTPLVPGGTKGVYLWDSPESAQQYGEGDLYEVRLPVPHVTADPNHHYTGSYVYPVDIPPENLRLLNEGTTAKTSMAADPAFIQQWIAEHGPYLYHGVREGHDPKQVVQQGIMPGKRDYDDYGGDPHKMEDWEMEDWWHTPRPGHVFMVTDPKDAYGTNLMRVDLRKLDPANLNPDDDQLRDLGGVPGMGEEGWVYEKDPDHPTLGEQAEALDWGSNPEDTHNAFETGTVAHRGTIPPEAVEHIGTRPDGGPWQMFHHTTAKTAEHKVHPKHKHLVDRVFNEGGFTVDPDLNEAPTDGYYVSQSGGDVIPADDFSADDIARKQGEVEPGQYIGAWLDNDQVYLDTTHRFDDHDAANDFGAHHGQQALWDANDNTVLPVVARPKTRSETGDDWTVTSAYDSDPDIEQELDERAAGDVPGSCTTAAYFYGRKLEAEGHDVQYHVGSNDRFPDESAEHGQSAGEQHAWLTVDGKMFDPMESQHGEMSGYKPSRTFGSAQEFAADYSDPGFWFGPMHDGDVPRQAKPFHFTGAYDSDPKMQRFFEDAGQGLRAPTTGLGDEDLPVDPEQRQFRQTWLQHSGPFDSHIETSIPGYAKNMAAKGLALSKAFPGASVLDLAAGHGSFGKALAAYGMQTTNVDAAPHFREQFEQNPVPGAEFAQNSLSDSFTDANGNNIEQYQGGTHDIVHEAMGFQFYSQDRARDVAQAKAHLNPGGLAIFDEKFTQTDPNIEADNEQTKDEWKLKHYPQADLDAKAQEVGLNDQWSTGMRSMQANQDQFEQVLEQNFRYVSPYWKNGNFAGYAASDNPYTLKKYLDAYGQEASAPAKAPETAPNALVASVGTTTSDWHVSAENGAHGGIVPLDYYGGRGPEPEFRCPSCRDQGPNYMVEEDSPYFSCGICGQVSPLEDAAPAESASWAGRHVGIYHKPTDTLYTAPEAEHHGFIKAHPDFPESNWDDLIQLEHENRRWRILHYQQPQPMIDKMRQVFNDPIQGVDTAPPKTYDWTTPAPPKMATTFDFSQPYNPVTGEDDHGQWDWKSEVPEHMPGPNDFIGSSGYFHDRAPWMIESDGKVRLGPFGTFHEDLWPGFENDIEDAHESDDWDNVPYARGAIYPRDGRFVNVTYTNRGIDPYEDNMYSGQEEQTREGIRQNVEKAFGHPLVHPEGMQWEEQDPNYADSSWADEFPGENGGQRFGKTASYPVDPETERDLAWGMQDVPERQRENDDWYLHGRQNYMDRIPYHVYDNGQVDIGKFGDFHMELPTEQEYGYGPNRPHSIARGGIYPRGGKWYHSIYTNGGTSMRPAEDGEEDIGYGEVMNVDPLEVTRMLSEKFGRPIEEAPDMGQAADSGWGWRQGDPDNFDWSEPMQAPQRTAGAREDFAGAPGWNRVPKHVYDWLDRMYPSEEHGIESDCVNPKCHHDWTPAEQHELAEYGEVKCPVCGTLQTHHGSVGSIRDEDDDGYGGKPGGGTRAGLTMKQQGDIGEQIIKRIGHLPSGPIMEHYGETHYQHPFDFRTQDESGNPWAVEVKTIHSQGQPRFKWGGAGEIRAKRTFAAENGMRPALAGVRLNYYTNKADVFFRPQITDPFMSDQTMQHVGSIDFSDLNPFHDPATGQVNVPEHPVAVGFGDDLPY